MTTLAFDVYGTLVDTNGVVALLRDTIGGRAGDFAQRWRDKQLEYSFRRALMKRYEPFAVCVEQSLEFVDASLGTGLSGDQKQSLLQFFRALPAFDDVEPALEALRDKGISMYAFSNGKADAVEGLLHAANIRDYFDGVVSVDGVRSFKPDPAVYNHFLAKTGAPPEDAWLISGNPFDVIGAKSAGWNGAWVKRSARAVFDPLDFEPDLVIGELGELVEAID